MTADLYIIAAGKGSRMGGNLPKALVPINGGDANLTTTLKQVGRKFNSVYVVTNKMIEAEWNDYFSSLPNELKRNVVNLPIHSGLGDGHAVLYGLIEADARAKSYGFKQQDDIVVCWGDVFICNSEIVDEMLLKPLSFGIIPVVKESNPYVTVLVNDSMECMSSDFSKYGESHPVGFHDQSIFRVNKKVIQDALGSLHSAFWKNGRYITPGGELSFLYAFHFLFNIGKPMRVYETDYPTMSFNTPEEVAEIQQKINAKWNGQVMFKNSH